MSDFTVRSRRLADLFAHAGVRLRGIEPCDGKCLTAERSCADVDVEARRTVTLVIGELSRAKLAANKLVHLRACPPPLLLMGIAARTHQIKTLAWTLHDLHLALLRLRCVQAQFHGLPAHAAATVEYDHVATALAELLPDSMRMLSATP